MTNICEVSGCNKKATYAKFYGKGILCIDHKGDLRTQYSVCECGNGRPSFNYIGVKARYCSKCKL